MQFNMPKIYVIDDDKDLLQVENHYYQRRASTYQLSWNGELQKKL